MWPFRRHSAFDIRSSQPYWLLRNGIGDAGPRLPGSLDCDVAIIGAGITGALIADALVATGRRVVMLEQREPAQGSTSASTALLQYENDTNLIDLMEMLGAERATLAYRACVQSFTLLEQRFPELLAQCDYQRRESVYLASGEAAVGALRAELAARRAIGIHVDWLDAAELRRRHGCRRPAALVSPLAATLDPVRFTRGVLSACTRHGVEVYSRCAVSAIEEEAAGLLLRIEGGETVRASHVVVAAGYESEHFLPEPVADIDNTFALITEPMTDVGRAATLPQIWETARPYLYLRGTRDGRIILGGADLPFRNALSREALLARQVSRLAASYEGLFGEKLPPVAYTWAGSFARTRDGLPYIGRAPGADPRLQFALCYGGNGITFAVHAGEMIRAGIEGAAHPLEPVFGFSRRLMEGVPGQAAPTKRRDAPKVRAGAT
jgi:glycine/D-amino acid oxidase-like deaminating enzyme